MLLIQSEWERGACLLCGERGESYRFAVEGREYAGVHLSLKFLSEKWIELIPKPLSGTPM